MLEALVSPGTGFKGGFETAKSGCLGLASSLLQEQYVLLIAEPFPCQPSLCLK